MAFAGRVHGDLEVMVGWPTVSLSAHVLLPQAFRTAIQMVLHHTRQLSHTAKESGRGWHTTVKSSFGIFFKPTLWILALAVPARQRAEAINAAVSFMLMASR